MSFDEYDIQYIKGVGEKTEKLFQIIKIIP